MMNEADEPHSPPALLSIKVASIIGSSLMFDNAVPNNPGTVKHPVKYPARATLSSGGQNKTPLKVPVMNKAV
jgi:hypothetical protein